MGQTILGQATFTDSQITEMQTRLASTTGLFKSTDYNNQNFNGDGDDILYGAETFLNEEEATSYEGQWDWSYDGALAVELQNGDYESLPTAATDASGNRYEPASVDYIHMAAVIAKVWDGDATSVTFSGQTKSKDLHALDLAESVFDVLNDQRQDPGLDFTDTGNYPTNLPNTLNVVSYNLFYYASKMSKYMESYSLVYDQLSGYSPFTTNFASVETWFGDANTFFYDRLGDINNQVFGIRLPENITGITTTAGTGWNDHQGNFKYYNVSGVGVDKITNGLRWVFQNRNWDLINYVGGYGVLFNNTNSRTFVWEMYKLTFKLIYSSDGTHSEWYRATSGSQFTETNGMHYVNINLWRHAKAAYTHAVAVENGLTGLTDIGQFFDYTTSDGSDEIYTDFDGTSTNGGPKGLLMALKHFSGAYRTVAEGGWQDERWGDAGKTYLLGQDDYRPTTIAAAMANTYYDDTDLETFYMHASGGYPGMRYYNDGLSPSITGVGAWHQHTLATGWGESGSMGGMIALGKMEGEVFGGAVTAIQWSDDVQAITEGETVSLAHTFTPSNPTNTGVTYSSDATGVLSNAGLWVSEGTANFTITADDTTNGTITDVMAVTTTISPTVLSIREPVSGRIKITAGFGVMYIGD